MKPQIGPVGWYVASDNQLVIDKLSSSLTKAYINNATITAQMQDASGNNIGSTINFTYQAASNGQYVGIAPASLDLSVGVDYLLIATIIANGYTHTQRMQRTANYDDR